MWGELCVIALNRLRFVETDGGGERGALPTTGWALPRGLRLAVCEEKGARVGWDGEGGARKVS